MATVLEQVEQAINRGDVEQAHELLRDELLSNPTAEAYYLASLVAFDAEQQREFLEKALAIYPFHKKAYLLMKRIDAQQSSTAKPRLETPSLVEPPVEAPSARQPPSTVMFPYAPLSKRIVAYLIDWFVLYITGYILLTLLGGWGLLPTENITYVDQSGAQTIPNPSLLLIASLVGIVTNTLYYVYFLTENNGQTPGKYLRGIRIVSLTGSRITRRQAFIRCIIGYSISSFFLLGYLWAFWEPNRQTWHDKLAKTIVIKTS